MDAATIPKPLLLPCATALALATAWTRPPSRTLESEGGLPQFGMVMASDGALLAAPDLDRDDNKRAFLRIERVEGNRVVQEARLSIGDVFFLPSIALHGNILMATHDLGELWIYERRGTRWHETQRLSLGEECRAYFLDALTLGEDVAVVATAERWCVLERRGSAWQIATTFERAYGALLAISGKRVLVSDGGTIYQCTHEREGWKRATIAKAPKGTWYSRLAASDRWMLVEDDRGMLYIHDLDDRARLHTKLPGRPEDRRWIDIGARVLATSGEKGGRAWTLVDNRWKDAGPLDGTITRGQAWDHRAAVGDHVWIGDPDVKSFTEPGRVHFFAVR